MAGNRARIHEQRAVVHFDDLRLAGVIRSIRAELLGLAVIIGKEPLSGIHAALGVISRHEDAVGFGHAAAQKQALARSGDIPATVRLSRGRGDVARRGPLRAIVIAVRDPHACVGHFACDDVLLTVLLPAAGESEPKTTLRRIMNDARIATGVALEIGDELLCCGCHACP